MKVRVKVFAVLKDMLERAELELELPPGASCSDVVDRLGKQFEFLTPTLRRCLVAVNGEYAAGDAFLTEGDEVAVLPPASGG